MRFRLRYLHHDLELSEGEFAIGRSAECQLSLDDPLVSRRHALLVVSRDGVLVEDLGSRNGVLVNGARIERPTPLQPGDRLLVGSQELTLLLGRELGGAETTSVPVGTNTLPTWMALKRDVVDVTPSIPILSSSGSGAPAAPDAAARSASERAAIDGGEAGVRRADVFQLLGRVADKALAMGRADEAERLLATPLGEVLESSRGGRPLPPELAEVAARFAAKLATATAKAPWIDYVVELYDTEGRPLPGSVIDELNNALRKVTGVDLARLRGYVTRLRERQARFGPAERFLLQRIEGLERLASLR